MPDGQFYGVILWYHLMAPFYGMCVPGFSFCFRYCVLHPRLVFFDFETVLGFAADKGSTEAAQW